MTGFSAVDYAVLLLYLVGITVFGTLFRRSQRTVKDYFLGAKNISWIVISLSIVASRSRAQPHRVGRSQLRGARLPRISFSNAMPQVSGGHLRGFPDCGDVT